MTGSVRVQRAARRAIARARALEADEITPDDLLAGALLEIGRFGIAWIGDWPIEVAGLENGAGPDQEPGPDEPAPASVYGPAVVELFERAAAVAREDGAANMGLVHLLVAFTEVDCELLAELGERHGFSEPEWRAALARGGVGAPPHLTDDGAEPRSTASSAQPDILSVDQAAEFLDVHTQTIRNYIRSGKLPAYRLAGERYIRILRKDLLGLLERVPADTPDEPEETTP